MAEEVVASSELDYYITFPSPQTTEFSTDVDNSQDSDNFTDFKEPVVFLLGWAGCEDKYLAKYSQIYDQKRCITIRYTAPNDHLFMKTYMLSGTGEKLLELLTDLGIEDSPVFFHIFSNGGAMVYRTMSQRLLTDPSYQHIKVCGCVLDSCPAPAGFGSIKAFFTATRITGVLQWLLGALFAIYLFLMRVVMRVKKVLSSSKVDDKVAVYEQIFSEQSRWPQLFLYSEADQMVGYQGIEKIMAHRAQLGVIIRSFRWKDSPHVMHLRRHREEYIRQCHVFLEFCITNM